MAQSSQSKITFLGTGGGRVVLASQTKTTAGLVVNINNCQVFVDPGPGALVKARDFKVRADKTDIIYVTHSHLDHVNDVNAIVAAMTLSGIHKKGTIIAPTSVLDGYEDDYPWVKKASRESLEKVHTVQPGDSVVTNGITFEATKTKHDEQHAVGLKLTSQGVTIGYTGDTSYFPGLSKEFKGCDILILNVLRPGNEKWKAHFNSEDAVRLIEAVRPELGIIRHYGAKMIKANPLYEAREIQRRTGTRTIAADDGTIVDLSRLITQKKSMV